MADEILLTFSADVASYEKAIDNIEAKTLGLQTTADQVSKRVSNIGKGNPMAGLNNSLKSATQETAKLNREVKKTDEESKKTTKAATNGFLQLRNELKEVRGQMAILAATGKENTEEFKKLQIQAGALQDQMKDLGTSIQLNAGDPLENLTGAVGSVQNSFLSLDFDGVARGFGAISSNISRIDLKTLKDGIGGVISGFGKLTAAILTNPLLLVAGAITGIIAVIATWGDSIDDIRERNEKLFDVIDRKSTGVLASYEAQKIAAEALGKSTEDIDKKILAQQLKDIKSKVDAKRQEAKFLVDNLSQTQQYEIYALAKLGKLRKDASILDIKNRQEYVELYTDTGKELIELDAEEKRTRAKLRAVDQAAQTKAEEERLEKQKEANEKYKKILEERQKKIVDKANENFQASVFKAQQEEANTIDAGQKKIQDILDKANNLRKEKAKTLEDDLRPIRIENLNNIINDEKKSYQERQAALEEALEKGYVTEKEYTEKSKQLSVDRINDLNSEIQSKIAFANSIADIGKSLNILASENAEDAAERDRLFTAFGIGLNLASSLANMIAGATEAAAATGALAPFTLVAYIAQGTALVLGAFAQVKQLLSAPVPKAAAKGEEYVTGGEAGKDSVPYMLMPGERVVTSAVNAKYWDELHAMHTGKYDKYINEKKILPALRKAMFGKIESENDSFAQNIANSILMNQSNWKGNNIVDKLAYLNEAENKRHSQLLKALKPRSAYRKK